MPLARCSVLLAWPVIWEPEFNAGDPAALEIERGIKSCNDGGCRAILWRFRSNWAGNDRKSLN